VALYEQYALELNVPVKYDLNHRFSEVIASGVTQVVFSAPGMVGLHRQMYERSGVFRANSLEQLELLVLQLLDEPERLRSITVIRPPDGRSVIYSHRFCPLNL